MAKSKCCYSFVRAASAVMVVLLLLCFIAFGQSEGSDLATPRPRPQLDSSATSSRLTPESAITPSTGNLNDQTARPAAGVSMDFAHEARIGPGDLVEIKVFGLAEMTQELRVSNAGAIVLPMIGPLVVQGLTTAELEEKITAALRDGGFVNEPQVSVSAKELHSSGVSVSGEVGRPGVYPVYGRGSLHDLIMVAGGLTPKAGHIVTLRHRDQPDAPINVDISSTTADSDPKFAVFPGDTVVVTKAGVVYVLGDVGRHAGIILEGNERMTVLQALALSGGAGKDAGLNGTRVIRKDDQGLRQFFIPLKKILKARNTGRGTFAGRHPLRSDQQR